jgi:plasmid stabilization system protein ParE
VSEVPFHPAAREEFFQAIDRYEAEVPGLGSDFIAEVERATGRILDFPDIGSTHLAGTRRVILRRFPFSIVYQVEPSGVFIVAVAHHSRRPGYWRDRL